MTKTTSAIHHGTPSAMGAGARRLRIWNLAGAWHCPQLLADRADVSGVVAACLRPPPYATRFHEGFGTLYTAEYRPAEGVVRYHWPGPDLGAVAGLVRTGRHPDPARHPVTRHSMSRSSQADDQVVGGGVAA